MVSASENNKRIAKNTVMLYFRMIFTMCVSFYTSRVVLNTLGVEDFGIYNVVGGVVTMFAFINSAMAMGTQRFLTFELGRRDFKRLHEVFNTCNIIHMMIAIVILLLAETIGLWFLYTHMTIPAERMDAAFWVFQCSVLAMMVMIISVPYNAAIIAHEKMGAFAYISILEVTLKLVVVYLLVISDFDKLKLYAVLILFIQILIRIIYNVYCRRHFDETKFKWHWDGKLFRELISFSVWNLLGHSATLLSNQGLNIVLNMFFGPAVNAARGVAVQLQSAVLQLSVNFQTALNPQITKTYAQGDLAAMHKLMERSSRFSFYLLYVISLPLFLMTHELLEIWLKIVPDYADIFLRLIMVSVIIDAVANPIMISSYATGNIKKYQLTMGTILMFITPIAYVVLKMGGSPVSVFIVHIVITAFAFCVRLHIIKDMISLNVVKYLSSLVSHVLKVVVISVPIPLLLRYNIEPSGIFYVIGLGILSVVIVGIAVLLVGLDKGEKAMITEKIRNIKGKIRY